MQALLQMTLDKVGRTQVTTGVVFLIFETKNVAPSSPDKNDALTRLFRRGRAGGGDRPGDDWRPRRDEPHVRHHMHRTPHVLQVRGAAINDFK